MNQLTFDLDLPLARSSDPLTSFQAADAAKSIIKSHEGLILATLTEHGPLGVDAIATRCRLTAHAAGKRMVALERNGHITLTGRVVKSTSGCNQREWACK